MEELKETLIDTNLTSGYHKSYWIDSVKPQVYLPLRQSKDTEVLVIGGGIAGLSVAYQLSRLGKKVIVLEDGFIGSGETGRTSAHLASAFDDRYYKLQDLFGKDGAKLVAESHSKAIDFIEDTINREKINCDFRRLPGYLFLHPTDDAESLDKELKAATEAGLKVRMVENVPGLSDMQRGIEFYDQAQFNPLKYIHGLCRAIIHNGGHIFCETHAKEINYGGAVTDEGFSIKAEYVVVATNTPVNDRYAMHLKQFPYRTYVIGALIEKDSLPAALWWDTGNHEVNKTTPPYHYIRVEKYNDMHDILLCGGEDHPTGLTSQEHIAEEDRYRLVEEWMRLNFPLAKEIVYQWSGQVMEPVDSLGYIGHNPYDENNVFIVTGDSGNGLTHGTIAGMLIPDLIMGVENPWEKIYDPSRFKIFKSTAIWFKEFVSGLITYVKEFPKNTDSVKLRDIKHGEGKIIELKDGKYGAYKDDEGQLHLVSAECTHLQCIVKWNGDEKSWDCPCHGSRFTFDGKVLNGPANEALFHHVIIDL